MSKVVEPVREFHSMKQDNIAMMYTIYDVYKYVIHRLSSAVTRSYAANNMLLVIFAAPCKPFQKVRLKVLYLTKVDDQVRMHESYFTLAASVHRF